MNPMPPKINSSFNMTLLANIVSVTDYLRPWKLFSLFCGIAILVIGSYLQPAMDWDIPISFIMAILTYVFAPVTSRTLFYSTFRRQWLCWLISLFGLWFSVDGCYWIYWSIKDPQALDFMRDANFSASLFLYFICGFLWLHDGSLKELFDTLKAPSD